jgi:hypothetical protein
MNTLSSDAQVIIVQRYQPKCHEMAYPPNYPSGRAFCLLCCRWESDILAEQEGAPFGFKSYVRKVGEIYDWPSALRIP